MEHELGKKQILVTGGAGFIGSALVWELNRQGYENIVVADYLGGDEKWRNLVPLRFTDYLEADNILRYAREDSQFFRGIHTIFHLGACSSTTETDARYLIENNFEFTKLLAYVARQHHIRFVYASSAATYGDGSAGMDDGSDRLDRLRPLNMYGYSKHLFDLYARRLGFLGEIVGLKYFNVFGPNESHKGDMRSLVAKAFGQVRDTGRIQLFRSHRSDYRDGEQMRDFLYVKDAVRMTIHLARNTAAGGLYNLGSGTANTWIDLARSIFRACGVEERIDFIDMPEAIREKYQYHTLADITRLRESGYGETVTPLADAVADYVQNYLQPDRRLGDEDRA